MNFDHHTSIKAGQLTEEEAAQIREEHEERVYRQDLEWREYVARQRKRSRERHLEKEKEAKAKRAEEEAEREKRAHEEKAREERRRARRERKAEENKAKACNAYGPGQSSRGRDGRSRSPKRTTASATLPPEIRVRVGGKAGNKVGDKRGGQLMFIPRAEAEVNSKLFAELAAAGYNDPTKLRFYGAFVRAIPVFIKWLKTTYYAPTDVPTSQGLKSEYDSEFLCELWRLGDEVQSTAFKDRIVSFLYWKLYSGRFYRKSAVLFFDYSFKNSQLQRLMIDFLVASIDDGHEPYTDDKDLAHIDDKDMSDSGRVELWKETARHKDAVANLWRLVFKEQTSRQRADSNRGRRANCNRREEDPVELKPLCSYHMHEAGEPCAVSKKAGAS